MLGATLVALESPSDELFIRMMDARIGMRNAERFYVALNFAGFKKSVLPGRRF